jgi:hypothetical protein
LLSIDRGTDAKVDEAPDGATSRSCRTDQIRRAVTGNKRRSIAVLAASMLLGTAGVALAGPSGDFVGPAAPTNKGLTKYGPTNPENGFPDWYRDSNQIELEGCYDARDTLCNAPPVPDPTQAPDLAGGNFPDEFFYMLADASLTAAGGNDVLAEFAIEGAFAADVADGQQMVFGRTRYRVRGGLAPDTEYTFTTPYGTDKVKTDAGATDLFVTSDVGSTPGAFGEVFGSQVGPFLRWDPAVAPAAPAGYVGDPGTPHKVIGGIGGRNFVMLQGPGAGGSPNPNPCPGLTATTSPNCIYTELFSVTGKKSTRGGVQVARATYSRDANGIQFDAMAGSKATQDIIVQDSAATRRFPSTKLVGDGERYYAHVKVAGTDKPATVDFVNNSDVPRTVRKNVPLVDMVTGTADYDTGTGKITVKAKSSDTSSTTTLTVPDFPAASFDATGTATITTAVPTDTVTVESSNNGKAVLPVTISGTTVTAAVPFNAAAGPDQANVTSGTTVTLDGSNSTGNIASYTWKPVTAGAPAVTQTPAGGAKATLAATNAGTAPVTYTYELTLNPDAGITTPAGTMTDTVDVTVMPVAPPVPKITVNGAAATSTTPVSVPRNLPVTLDGSTSTNAGNFLWVRVSGPALPAGTVTDQPKLTFTYPKTTGMVLKLIVTRPGQAIGPNCDTNAPNRCKSTTVTLSGQDDPLAITKARFIGDSSRWVVTGTATSTNANNVHVYSGQSISDTRLIGSSPVAADGTWAVDVRGSAIPLTTCQCVTVISDRGGELQNVPLEKPLNLPATDVAPTVRRAPETSLVPGATVPAATTTAAAAKTVAAVPLAGAVTRAVLAPTAVTVAPAVAGGTVASVGLGLTVNVPQGITLLQVRVLAGNGKPLYNAFQLVKAGSKAKIKIRSAKLNRSLKSGKRYSLEVRAGTTRANLGKPVVKKFRVKR